MSGSGLKIGIDVGGTNTDAAVLRGNTVLGSSKVATSADVTTGVQQAVERVLSNTSVDAASVDAVMIGTTHFLNALIQRQELSRSVAIRLCGPTSRALPPMVDWPQDLQAAIGAESVFEDGGVEFDGREITPLNEQSIRSHCARWRDAGISSVAVSGVFALVDPQQELLAGRIISEEMPDARISLSHQIGQNGLLPRESATILNASLQPLAEHTIKAFENAFAALNLNARLYLTQNDGTLMAAEYAARFPAHTIASGPTNSMRGAAFLTGIDNAAVVDIGGTTTDIGIIQGGFPRARSEGATIAGVRTNFRVPDVLSFGLGGGSVVSTEPSFAIGPESVGYQLQSRGRCFGGDVLTATDLIVAMGHAALGERSLVNDLPDSLLKRARSEINRRIEQTIDRMKPSADPIDAIFVGGGAILVGGELDGVRNAIIPEHSGAANAVGAAIAQVSGEVDRIVALENHSREQALQLIEHDARRKAVDAGANSETLSVSDVIETPLAYLPGNAVRMTVKVVGELRT